GPPARLSQPGIEFPNHCPAFKGMRADLREGLYERARLLDRARLKLDEAHASRGCLEPEPDPIALAQLPIPVDDIADITQRDEQLGPLTDTEPVALPSRQNDLLWANLDEAFPVERQASGFRLQPTTQPIVR